MIIPKILTSYGIDYPRVNLCLALGKTRLQSDHHHHEPCGHASLCTPPPFNTGVCRPGAGGATATSCTSIPFTVIDALLIFGTITFFPLDGGGGGGAFVTWGCIISSFSVQVHVQSNNQALGDGKSTRI
jgi:hypothetical protein